MNRHIEEDKNFTTKSQLFEATFLQSSSVAEAELSIYVRLRAFEITEWI